MKDFGPSFPIIGKSFFQISPGRSHRSPVCQSCQERWEEDRQKLLSDLEAERNKRLEAQALHHFPCKSCWRWLFLIDLSWTCSSFPIENDRSNRNSGPIPLHINSTHLRKSYWPHDPSGQVAASCHTFLISLAWCFTWHCHYDYRRRNAWLVQSYAWPKRLRIACARSNVQCWRCCWGLYVNLNLKNGHEWLDFCKLINASSNIAFTFVHFTD